MRQQLMVPQVVRVCGADYDNEGWEDLYLTYYGKNRLYHNDHGALPKKPAWLDRLLSAGNNTFKYDSGSEDREGGQCSTVSVFTRDAKGVLRHFYPAHPRMAPDIQERGIDLLTPIWHFMDFTARGSWYASLSYGTKVRAASDLAHGHRKTA